MADWVGLDSDVPTLRPQIKPYPNLSRFQIEANLHGVRWAALGVLWYRLGATATATAKQEYARDLLVRFPPEKLGHQHRAKGRGRCSMVSLIRGRIQGAITRPGI